MDLSDAAWHAMNFFAPAFGIGALTTALAKLLWRKALAGRSWLRLCVWSIGVCAVALVAGLVVTGRDGHMGTYGAMVVGCASALWWAGFRTGGGKGG